MGQIDLDLRAILDRLQGTGDPYILKIINNMDTQITKTIELRDSLPTVNGSESYTYKRTDFYVCELRVR